MIISRTPFRISFFGGGTDYPVWYEKFGGSVISATINKYAYITVRKLPPFFDFKYRIQYYLKEEVSRLEEIKHPVVREAAKLLKIPYGLDINHNADLPARSGLGSSSTFSVGMFHALYSLENKLVTKRELALSAINLEQNIIGEAVGSQDQTAAAFGGLNFIEFDKKQIFEVKTLPLNIDRLNELQDNLLLCFTGFSRTAEKISKHQINYTHKLEKELFLIKDLTFEAKEIILDKKRSLDEFGKLLNEQWILKRNLTNKITNNNIDEIYEAGIKSGALGGKLLGAGGGGFMLFYAHKKNHKKIKEKLKNKLFVPFRFENTGSQIIYYSHE